jgi:phosphate transport system protein
MTAEHTIKAFDADLNHLKRKIAEMGSLVVVQVHLAQQALTERDVVRAQNVISGDKAIDALQREIEEKAILVIARRQPLAIDLRELVGAVRIANDLERAGDQAENIAKNVLALGGEPPPSSAIVRVKYMADLAIDLLNRVLDSYVRRDIDEALAVWRKDQEIDLANNSLFRELLTYMMEDPHTITPCTHLLVCARNIERIGDHATNIAETVFYIVEGHTVPGERPKGDAVDLSRRTAVGSSQDH